MDPDNRPLAMAAHDIQRAKDLSVAVTCGNTIADKDTAEQLRKLKDTMARLRERRLGTIDRTEDNYTVAIDGLVAIIKDPIQATRRDEAASSALPVAFASVREEVDVSRARVRDLKYALREEKARLRALETCYAAIPARSEWKRPFTEQDLSEWLKMVKFLNLDAEHESCSDSECSHEAHVELAPCARLTLRQGDARLLISSTHFGIEHHKQALLDFLDVGYEREHLENRSVCIQLFYDLEPGRMVRASDARECHARKEYKDSSCAAIMVSRNHVTFAHDLCAGRAVQAQAIPE